LKRIFIFSYHGKETFQTSYYRLLSLSEHLSENAEVYFIHGTTEKEVKQIKVKGNFIEIPLNYAHGFFQKTYKSLLRNGKNSIAKILLIFYYFFTGKEIFDLGKEFQNYIKKTNLTLSPSDIVVVSFPSIAIHNLGFLLKQKYGCKLVLDYRDPGVFGYQLLAENKIISLLRKTFLKKREIRNLKNADLVIAISDSIKALFPVEFQEQIAVIRNGFISHKANLDLITHNPYTFILLYLGTIYSPQLKDQTFFKALRIFIDRNNILPQHFQLKFLGSEGCEGLREIIKQFNLDPYTQITPRMPIELAYTELYNASMFLQLKFGKRKEIITSKQYEYLAFQKPILLPLSDHGDLDQSITDYKAGYICNSLDEIVDVLEKQYKNHFDHQPELISRTEEELYQLSRRSQQDKLFKLIEKL